RVRGGVNGGRSGLARTRRRSARGCRVEGARGVRGAGIVLDLGRQRAAWLTPPILPGVSRHQGVEVVLPRAAEVAGVAEERGLVDRRAGSTRKHPAGVAGEGRADD